VPTQYQNVDDSSWVNPARPVDPMRRDKIKSEVDKLFLRHLEQTRMKSLAETPLFESKQESDAFAAQEEESTTSKPSGFVLAAEMTTRPGSFDEDRGWAMPSDTTALEIARHNKRENPDPPSIDNEMAWSMPAKSTIVDVVYRKTEKEQKDYRYTYITADSTLVKRESSNEVTSKSSYWDKVRQNYFHEGNVPLPTDGASHAKMVGDNSYRPFWKSKAGGVDTDDDEETNDSEWLPPDYSTNPNYRAIAAQARSMAAPDEHERRINDSIPLPDTTAKSIVPPISDRERSSSTSRVRHVDFAGRVMYHNESDSTDAIPWVPKPEDLDFESSSEEQEVDDSGSDDQGGPHEGSDGDSTSSDYGNWTVYSSALRFDDDDDDFVQNPTKDGSSLPKGDCISDDNEALEVANRQLRAMEEGQEHGAVVLKNSKGSARESSSTSMDGSIDSVFSYTGRISFCTTPELITFEDDPNEERGTHYTKIGKKAKEEKIKSRSDAPDPCVYYSLCCIMVAVPVVVLTIMFVFVIDVNGDDKKSDGN
jgi:hypothetical protein